jgi:hypothetical protein
MAVAQPDHIRPPTGLPRRSRDARTLGKAIFPILPYQLVSRDESIINTDALGSVFFVTSWGAFLTAKHVVEHPPPEAPPFHVLFLWNRQDGAVVLTASRVLDLQLHPQLDIAFGVARIPAMLPSGPRTLTLSTRPLTADDRIGVYGYSHTETPTEAEPDGRLAFWPADHHGRVQHVRLPGSPGYRGHREYIVTAETLGGASGGPLFKRTTLEVHGVVRSGLSDACGFATDTREFVGSWPLRALGGLTLAQFSSKHPRALRVR